MQDVHILQLNVYSTHNCIYVVDLMLFFLCMHLIRCRPQKNVYEWF